MVAPDEPSRARRDRPPLPRLRRPAARVAGRRGARRRRPRPAARQDARRRRARRRRAARSASSGALFILNDRPDLVEACGADGVHVGQDDMSPAEARAMVGPDRIVGRSTHAPDQADAAQADPDVDYLAVGPVWETPTKPGRPAAGLEYVAYAARTVTKPWFAIGGLDAGNVSAVVERGASGSSSCARSPRRTTPRPRRASSRRSLSRTTGCAAATPVARARRRRARLARAVEARRAAGGGHRGGDRRRRARTAARSRRRVADGDADAGACCLRRGHVRGGGRDVEGAVLGGARLRVLPRPDARLRRGVADVRRQRAGRPLRPRHPGRAGVLFWKLVRAMARLQMPKRPGG